MPVGGGAQARATAWPRLSVACAVLLLTIQPGAVRTVGAAATGPAVLASSKPAQAAHLLIELPSGRVLSSSALPIIRTPVLPGSIIKVATLLAALETQVIAPDTRLLCRRHVEVDGHSFTCSHPRLAGPLSPVDALAQSCNYFFASIASRVKRDAFDRALAAMGLPPSDPAVPMVVAGLGLGGIRATPEQLLNGYVRLVTTRPASVGQRDWDLLREGLRDAAQNGTAAAFAESRLPALAKTGTAPMPGGGYHGLVVAVAPPDHPTRGVVVLAPGGSGADAARIAASLLVGWMPRGPQGDAELPRIRVGRVGRDGRYTVEPVELEEYVSRAVAAEATPGASPEEEKALAIAARTYALGNRDRHGSEGFDLCDLTHCQALRQPTTASRVAAAATAGRVIRDTDGRLAQVFYSASCGGRSERPSHVWPGAADPSYLASRSEPECELASSWSTDVSAQDLSRALKQAGLHGSTIRALGVVERTPSGRAGKVRIEGFEPDTMSGEAFRLVVGRALGWQLLKSTLFDVARTARGYRFTGRGAGHGVGLCVLGASRLARSGRTADEILRTYFPGTHVEVLKPGSEATRVATASAAPTMPRLAIVLPAGEERAERELRDLVAAALSAMATRSALAPPARLRLVVHDTVEAYHQATHKPWWTSGATLGDEVHLIPLPALRRRGLLGRTLAHEMAHAVVGTRLSGQPMWVSEGAAMFLSGELSHGDGRPNVALAACPSDADFLRAKSADALGKAYAAAGECFRREGKARVGAALELK